MYLLDLCEVSLVLWTNATSAPKEALKPVACNLYRPEPVSHIGDVQGKGKGKGNEGGGGDLRTTPAITYAACASG